MSVKLCLVMIIVFSVLAVLSLFRMVYCLQGGTSPEADEDSGADGSAEQALKSAESGRRIGQALSCALLTLIFVGLSLSVYMYRDNRLLVLACADELASLGSAVEMYSQVDECVYPPRLDYLIPFYVDDLPDCPAVPAVKSERRAPEGEGWENSLYEKNYEHNSECFTISCSGHNHTGWGGTEEGYPKYSSRHGLQLEPGSSEDLAK